MLRSHRFVLDVCFSTNDIVKDWLYKNEAYRALAILSHDQLAGKGQRGRSWYSTPYESLLMSIGFKSFWPSDRPVFSFQAAVAISVVHVLRETTGVPVLIKWPNDIYYNNRKLGGILTEAQSQGQHWWDMIVGLGLNLNQLHFPPELPNPISLRQITGRSYQAEELFHTLCDALELKVPEARDQNVADLLNTYKKLTDSFLSFHTYSTIPDGIVFKGRLTDIKEEGSVYLETEEGKRLGPFQHHRLQRLYEPG